MDELKPGGTYSHAQSMAAAHSKGNVMRPLDRLSPSLGQLVADEDEFNMYEDELVIAAAKAQRSAPEFFDEPSPSLSVSEKESRTRRRERRKGTGLFGVFGNVMDTTGVADTTVGDKALKAATIGTTVVGSGGGFVGSVIEGFYEGFTGSGDAPGKGSETSFSL